MKSFKGHNSCSLHSYIQYTQVRFSGVFAILFRSVWGRVCAWLSTLHKARLRCTLSSFGFCSGELIVLLFAVEMDRSAGRQRLVEFYSAIQLPKCAFIASVTPIINYSPRHSAGLAGCYGDGPRLRGAPWLHAVVVTVIRVFPLLVVPFNCQTQLTRLNLLSQIRNLKDYASHHSELQQQFRPRYLCVLCFFNVLSSLVSCVYMSRKDLTTHKRVKTSGILLLLITPPCHFMWDSTLLV